MVSKGTIDKIVEQMRASPHKVDYEDLKRVCVNYFGDGRQNGTSHCIFKMPWAGDPRVNIQRGRNGLAKGYQVKQVLAAIERLLRLQEGDIDDS